jgi:AbrB family looped-hinge helix DNA binding protein
MPVVKIRTNRQITIPKRIFDELGLKEGDYMEVTRAKDKVVVKPKRLVDPEDTLSPEEEKLVERGFEELKRGQYVTWEQLKHDLDL